ncbi:MAG: SHOCT domain-containing protein [Clostridiales bacterium]|nr:SHOCT domain-containing protein [Clostridiales bacterium]
MEEYIEYIIGYGILVLAIAACLGLIPANIAKKKGYSFGLWWFYGWMLFIVAIIHVSLIPDKNIPQSLVYQPMQNNSYCPPFNAGQSAADELKKYKELFDAGVITEDEFQAKKDQLLKLV